MPSSSKFMDYPENQQKALTYIRRTGKVAGVGKVLNCHTQTVVNYMSKSASFKARVEMAKKNFEDGNFDDLQRLWNRDAGVYNGATVDHIFKMVLEGEVSMEKQTIRKPVKVKGVTQYDEEGEPILEIEKVLDTEYHKPAPKWVLELAISLMNETFAQPDILKVSPTIILQFIRHIKSETNLKGDALQQVIGSTESFEKQLKSEVLALQARKKDI